MRKYILTLMILLMIMTIAACGRGGVDGDWPAANEASPLMATQRQALRAYSVTADASPPTAPAPPPGASPASDVPHFYGVATGSLIIEYHETHIERAERARHIIQTASTELETEYFDEVVAELRQLAPASGGYIESEQISGRRWRVLHMTLRVPSAAFDDVLAQIESLADVRHSNRQAEDVTDQFYDTAARLETRRIEEERLLALIQDAENVHDLLELERRLSNTRLQIETYNARLTNLAGRIAYSTITVTLFDIAEEEIVPIAGPTMGERIGGAFGDSVDSVVRGFQNFVIFMAGIIIPLVFWGVIAFIAYKLIRRVRRKLKNSVIPS
ncbi:MAG: DUF4349 domain-containing protein [Firmicutes bacterium]|nr:DUF4349 domain-containing protein [Bacillota bacterium]